MSAEKRKQFIRRAMFGMWAMGTLILLFTVVLLVYEMSDRGYNPLPAPEASDTDTADEAITTTTTPTQRVTLYFANESATTLSGEFRDLSLGAHTQENCRTVIEALIAGPQGNLTPIFPPTVEVRNVFLIEDGELVVDFSQELGTDPNRPRSASSEALMVYGLANSVAQSAVEGESGGSVERIRFLFEGSPLGDSFPDHLDLSGPIAPDSRWLASSGSGSQ